MTQIIGVITEKYALLASDRMVTIINGFGEVNVRDDNTCKLVNFGNIAGISHSGLAEIDGQATNEWIAKTLAENNCKEIFEAVNVLRERLVVSIKDENELFRTVEILVAGWAVFEGDPELRPHFAKISNCYDEKGRLLSAPKDDFDIRVMPLKKGEPFLYTEAGFELSDIRRMIFDSQVMEILGNNGNAKEILIAMAQEITRTALTQEIKTVGTRILCMCLPRSAAVSALQNESTFFLAKEPSDQEASFFYFDKSYNDLVQFGPTFVINGTAVTDLVVKNNAEKNLQSSQMRILHMGKKGSVGAVVHYTNKESKPL
jgi:hypothetical protein